MAKIRMTPEHFNKLPYHRKRRILSKYAEDFGIEFFENTVVEAMSDDETYYMTNLTLLRLFYLDVNPGFCVLFKYSYGAEHMDFMDIFPISDYAAMKLLEQHVMLPILDNISYRGW